MISMEDQRCEFLLPRMASRHASLLAGTETTVNEMSRNYTKLSTSSHIRTSRDPRSSVRLKWDGVSRAHAWIDLPSSQREQVRYELVCNGSGNGTFVNGHRVSRYLSLPVHVQTVNLRTRVLENWLIRAAPLDAR